MKSLTFMNFKNFIINLEVCHATQNEKELLRIVMEMQVLGSAGRHLLPNNTKRRGIHQVPAIAHIAPIIMFTVVDVFYHWLLVYKDTPIHCQTCRASPAPLLRLTSPIAQKEPYS